MSRSIEIYLADEPDLAAILPGLGWQLTTHGYYEVASRSWSAMIFLPTPMSAEDAPEEAQALQAGIAWLSMLAWKGAQRRG
jgi:hypothetical protein